jgi:prepilin-type N-terminal cleavage/methylation domain-containing protein
MYYVFVIHMSPSSFLHVRLQYKKRILLTNRVTTYPLFNFMTSASSRVRRGFTLIELLVVIAIIGILSAVVLASLNTAQNRGGDAAVQSDLDGVRTEAEVYYNGTGNNTYGGADASGSCSFAGSMFLADPTIVNSVANILSSNGNVQPVCNTSTGGASYAMGAQLKTTPNKYWCVDSTGVSKPESLLLGTGVYACP